MAGGYHVASGNGPFKNIDYGGLKPHATQRPIKGGHDTVVTNAPDRSTTMVAGRAVAATGVTPKVSP